MDDIKWNKVCESEDLEIVDVGGINIENKEEGRVYIGLTPV